MPGLIKHGDLRTLGIQFRADFLEGLRGKTPSTWDRVATRIPMATKTMEFGILHDISGMREWKGDRFVTKLKRSSYSVTAKKFERTIEVDRVDIETDNLGLYAPRFRTLGQVGKLLPDQRVWKVLRDNGLCYDGKPFFADDHPEGDDVASNQDMSGDGPVWYLLDTTKPIKPLVWCVLREPQLDSLDQGNDEVVFRRDVVQYGLRALGEAGYGLWQLAYRSNQPLNDENFNAAMTEMMKRTTGEPPPDDDPDGSSEILGVRPNVLVVPSDLRADATSLIEMQIVAGGGSDAAGISNRNFRAVDVLVEPRLDG
ncbi:MAG: Mu-like prophage major head subunit gpT family protein [Myxococcota bacterium]